MTRLNINPTVRLAAATLLCVFATSSIGQARAPQSPDEAGPSPDAQYTLAVRLLDRGISFERAISILRGAVAQDPMNPKYHRALGCALSDRAASIAFTASHIDRYILYHARYIADVLRWQAAQDGQAIPSDPLTVESELKKLPNQIVINGSTYDVPDSEKRFAAARFVAAMNRLETRYDGRFIPGSPAPIEPVLYTKDDKKRFRLDFPQSAALFSKLTTESEAEFLESERCARTNIERAECVQDRSWAELMLVHHFPAMKVSCPYDHTTILNGFRKALDLNPKDPEYLRAEADAIIETAKVQGLSGSPEIPETAEAIRVYKDALSLEHQDTTHINARIFSLLEPESLSSLRRSPDAMTALEGAIQADPVNAYPRYILSRFQLDAKQNAENQSASEAEIIGLVETANNLPQFSADLYTEAVPRPLAVAWMYGKELASVSFSIIPQLATQLCNMASMQRQSGKMNESERTLLAVISMGKSTLVPCDQSGDGAVFALNGSYEALVSGYNGIAQYYKATDKPDDARKASEAANAARVEEFQRNDDYMIARKYGYADL